MNKRTNILQAAAKIINNEGVHGITISKVADEAGIGKSTVYEYFKSKEELIRETIQFVGDLYLDTIKQTLLANHEGFEKTVKKLIRLVIGAIRKGNSHYILMMSECKKTSGKGPDMHGKMKQVVMNFRRKLFDILEAVMTVGEEEGIIKKPGQKMFLLVWQNLMIVFAFEFSGVDEFLETLGIDIEEDDDKRIDIIYHYLLKVLQIEFQEA